MTRILAWLPLMLLAIAPPAFPCSTVAPPSPPELVRLADVIVRARAERVPQQPGRYSRQFGGSPTQIEFRVVRSLKGKLPGDRITFNGTATARDERNRGAVPYDVARASADGPCVTLEYRLGGDYLLFLRRAYPPARWAQPDRLTPYWMPLAPTNEQVFGPDDPWEGWVRAQVKAVAGR